MPIINFSNPTTVLLALLLFVLVLILGKETHKGVVIAIMLFTFIAILVGHSIEILRLNFNDMVQYKALTTGLLVDFVFIFLSFISYLWVDDIQSKVEKKKSINNSLSWFWKEV